MARKYLPLAQPDPEESFEGNHDLVFWRKHKGMHPCSLFSSFSSASRDILTITDFAEELCYTHATQNSIWKGSQLFYS